MLLVFTRLDERRYISRITRHDGLSLLVNGAGPMRGGGSGSHIQHGFRNKKSDGELRKSLADR
jgi:hypothetical protein